MCFGQTSNKHLLLLMPGTIQVSVLDFEGLHSSSSLSRTCVKVSMGKREYETWDKGEFSFPLTTLRDNLIVSLQDAEGNEMSRIGVETRLLVEKGIWDDTFLLEGGGHVRMKLQFFLSEEDRNRIRVMRESALRKKHSELLNNEASRHYALSAGRDVTSSLQPKYEGSDAATQTGQLSNPPAFFKNQNFVHEDKENDAVRYRDTSSTTDVSQRFEVYPKEVSTSGDESGSAVSLTDEPLRMSHQKEALRRGITESKVSLKDKFPVKLKEARVGDSEKRSLLESDQIRSMISVFENSNNQERISRQPPLKSQPKRTAEEDSLASSPLDEIKMVKKKSAPLAGGMEEYPALTRKNEESSSFVKKLDEVTPQDMGHLYGLKEVHFQTRGTTADMKDKPDVMQEVGKVQGKTTFEDLLRASTSETASVSGRVFNEHLGTHQRGNAMAYGARGGHPKGSQELNVQGASGDECYSPEGRGGWIFPVKGKRLCLSTASKQIMNIMGGFCAETEVQPQKMSSSASENMNKSTLHGSAANIKARDGEKSSQRFRKSKAEVPIDGETSRGPVGQAVRAAIMVGFVTLVLFTRQRK